MVRRGCKRSFGPGERKASRESLAPSEAWFAPVQPYFTPVEEAVRSLGPKELLHPLLTTFGNFLFSTPLPGGLVCNPKHQGISKDLGSRRSGVHKRVVFQNVVLAAVPPERKPERGYVRMLSRNENRNEGTFACCSGMKTGTRVRWHVPPERERGHIRQNHPFTKPPFCPR